MEDKKKEAKGIGKILTEKGFYIVLFICAAVIGICAWLLWSSANTGDTADSASEVLDYAQASVSEPAEPELKIDSAEQAEETESQLEEETVLPDEQDAVSVGEWDDSLSEDDAGEAAEAEETDEAAESVETAVPTPEEMACVWPITGELAAGYSVEKLVYNNTMDDWRTHDGIDIKAEIGTKVKAMAAGTVTAVYTDDMLGTTVVIDHGNGLKSTYSNLAGTPTVEVDEEVFMGDVIGAVGDTALGETNEAAHLHFALSLDGESVDPNDYF